MMRKHTKKEFKQKVEWFIANKNRMSRRRKSWALEGMEERYSDFISYEKYGYYGDGVAEWICDHLQKEYQVTLKYDPELDELKITDKESNIMFPKNYNRDQGPEPKIGDRVQIAYTGPSMDGKYGKVIGWADSLQYAVIIFLDVPLLDGTEGIIIPAVCLKPI
jgi:hypothetical protein